MCIFIGRYRKKNKTGVISATNKVESTNASNTGENGGRKCIRYITRVSPIKIEKIRRKKYWYDLYPFVSAVFSPEGQVDLREKRDKIRKKGDKKKTNNVESKSASKRGEDPNIGNTGCITKTSTPKIETIRKKIKK